MEKLFRAQKVLLRGEPKSAEHAAVLRDLNESVPAPVLAHFLRLIAAGQKGVAQVSHGVCSGCHLRVPLATVAVLTASDDLHLCENCSCYLALAPGEELPAPPVAKPVAARRRGRPAARVAELVIM